MVVLGTKHIDSFLRKHPECRQELAELVRDLEAAHLPNTNAFKERYPSSKIVSGRVVVLKVRGNRYRLTAKVAFNTQVFVVIALETHAEYDRRRLG